MRSKSAQCPSVSRLSFHQQINNIRRNLVMRQTVRALAFTLSVVILSSSLPALGAEPLRDRSTRERSTPTLVIKKIMKRFFGITSNEELTPPHPAPANATTTP
jgi:hypothetical protein